MKVYLVNLDRSPDRLSRMTALFRERGIAFERVPAVDGMSIGPDRDRARYDGTYPLGPGEIGCFLSHRSIWEKVARVAEPIAAVFEDDVHFGEDIREFLADGSWIPSDADIVKLETDRTRTMVDRRALSTHFGRSISQLRSVHSGTGGYVVTRSGAVKLLKYSDTFNEPVDQYMFNELSPVANVLTIYQVSPAICIQDMFLEEPAKRSGLESTLSHERPKQMTSRLGKLKREIARPFVRAGTYTLAALKGYAWERIDFR